MSIKRIAMWSGPRNISTAMMRSFENRSDTDVLDEPFYAFFLASTQCPHPMAEEVMASQPTDFAVVAEQLQHGTFHQPVQYQKHMTQHIPANADMHWAANLQHCFLIRHPAEVVASYTQSRGLCSAQDIGIERQWLLYQELSELSGQDIPIVEGKDVLTNPRAMLSQLCQSLHLPFDENMLQWPAGYRKSDGVWASHWYHSVINSSGFAAPSLRKPVLTKAQQEVVDKVWPAFEQLQQRKLRL